MEEEAVTPHRLAYALRNLEEEEVEFRIDIEQALKSLPEAQRNLLRLYAEHRSPQEAVQMLNLKGNAHRLFTLALKRLTITVNGS